MRLGDLAALKEDLRRFFPTEVLEGIEPKTLFAQILHDIDNAPTVNKFYDYNEGYKDGFSLGFKRGSELNERPQGEWVSVSERLPEINVDVIVTDIETTGTYSAYYLGDGFWECDNGTHTNRIIAWMPFPEPYKAEDKKNETND